MNSLLLKFTGSGVGARARRSAIWSFIDFGGAQGLRLISNLILTRLLFPEAFGLMAIVTVITAGLSLFSDTGAGPSIIQSKRGDDPDFLNTAWTIQVFRGLALWLIVLAVAVPVASLYGEPQLTEILPIAGLTLLIQGFKPTTVYTVNRHLAIGNLIRIKLSTQFVSLLITLALAWQLQSVWALVIGNIIGSSLGTIANHAFLPGIKNKFRFEQDAARQLFQFGKWVLLSTAAGFIVNQGDRAILGLYVSLETLGIYNIGYFLASIPLLLSFALQGTVMTPLYRLKPPSESNSNLTEIFRARRLIALSMLTITGILAFIGPPLVDFLYDPRYKTAGAMITLFSVSVVPIISLNTIGAALLGSGDSRAMFFVVGTTAVLQTALLIFGIQNFGIPGALLAPGLAVMASHPLRVIFSLKYRVFDPVQDFGISIVGFILPLSACLYYYDRISALF